MFLGVWLEPGIVRAQSARTHINLLILIFIMVFCFSGSSSLDHFKRRLQGLETSFNKFTTHKGLKQDTAQT